MDLRKKVENLLRQKVVTAKELEKILIEAGWIIRQPPKNQPHFYKPGVAEYIVVDRRYGANSVQKKDLAKKYLKRLLEYL